MNPFIEALHQGKELTNAKVWKDRQLVTNHLISFIMTLLLIAEFMGYHIPLSEESVTMIIGICFTIWNTINALLVTITSTKVGIKAPRQN